MKKALCLLSFIFIMFAGFISESKALSTPNCIIGDKNNGPIVMCTNSLQSCQALESVLDEVGNVMGSCTQRSTSCYVVDRGNFNQTVCQPDINSCMTSQESTSYQVIEKCMTQDQLKQSGDYIGYEIEVANQKVGKQGVFMVDSLANCKDIESVCDSDDRCQVVRESCRAAVAYDRGFEEDRKNLVKDISNFINGQKVIDLSKAVFDLMLTSNSAILVTDLVTIPIVADPTCDNDADCDGVKGDDDPCPNDADNQCDQSQCQNDQDCDGSTDDVDNCPVIPNANQLDDDNDQVGNLCDPDHPDYKKTSPKTNLDRDGDGMPNSQDPCPDNPDKNCGQNIEVDCSQPGTLGTETNCLRDPLETECYIDFEGETVCETNNIFTLIYKVIRGLTNILIPLAVVAIIWAGLQFVTAQGSETKVSNAKKTLTNVVIGVALILGARIIVEMINAIRLTL